MCGSGKDRKMAVGEILATDMALVYIKILGVSPRAGKRSQYVMLLLSLVNFP